MPAARAGREQRRAADEMVEQGLEHQRLEVGPGHARSRGHRDEVAAVEHALDHAAVEQRPGERRRLGALRVGEIARAGVHHGLAGQELAGRRVRRLLGTDQHQRDVASCSSPCKGRALEGGVSGTVRFPPKPAISEGLVPGRLRT